MDILVGPVTTNPLGEWEAVIHFNNGEEITRRGTREEVLDFVDGLEEDDDDWPPQKWHPDDEDSHYPRNNNKGPFG